MRECLFKFECVVGCVLKWVCVFVRARVRVWVCVWVRVWMCTDGRRYSMFRLATPKKIPKSLRSRQHASTRIHAYIPHRNAKDNWNNLNTINDIGTVDLCIIRLICKGLSSGSIHFHKLFHVILM